MVTSEASVPLRRSKQHNKNNFLIHQLYLRQVCPVGSHAEHYVHLSESNLL